jgi:hypothetical protein
LRSAQPWLSLKVREAAEPGEPAVAPVAQVQVRAPVVVAPVPAVRPAMGERQVLARAQAELPLVERARAERLVAHPVAPPAAPLAEATQPRQMKKSER